MSSLSAYLFILCCYLTALVSSLPISPSLSVKPRLSISVTRNDLVNGNSCKPVTVIFARGTIELGNVGLLAGPPFFNALEILIGKSNLAVQGVDYAADFLGYFEGGDPAGAAKVASLTNLASTKCPKTQIVLSGYSQGAQLIHRGLTTTASSSFTPVTTAAKSQIAAIVLFGDPDDNDPFPGIPESEVDTYCAEGDLICDDLPIPLPAHLSYAGDALEAAQFVQGKVKV